MLRVLAVPYRLAVQDLSYSPQVIEQISVCYAAIPGIQLELAHRLKTAPSD